MNFTDCFQMQNRKKILLSLIILPLIAFSQDKSMSQLTLGQKEDIGNYLAILEYSYYANNFEHAKNLSDLLDYFADEWKFPSVYRDSISMEKIGNTLVFLYNTDTICIKQMECIECDDMTSNYFYHKFIGIYDDLGHYRYVKHLTEKWTRLRHKVYKKCKNGGFNILRDSSENYRKYVLYEYDLSKGLSIHNVCKSEIELQNNEYTQELSDLASKICKKYNVQKVIFTAFFLYKK